MNDTVIFDYDKEVEKEGMEFEYQSGMVKFENIKQLVLDKEGRLTPCDYGNYPYIRFSCNGRRTFFDQEDTVKLEWSFPGEECLEVDFRNQDWSGFPWDNEDYLYVSDL